MDNRTTIQAQLHSVLEAKDIRRVIYAGADVAPSLHAFVVDVPSMVIVLDGACQVELSSNGGAAPCSLKAGDVLYAPPNCWYRPTWKHAGRTLTILFGQRQTGFSLINSSSGRKGPSPEVVRYYANLQPSSVCRKLLDLCDQAGQPQLHGRIAEHLVHALLLSCEELLEDRPAAAMTRARVLYESVCSYVQQYFHQPLMRDSVAAEFAVTPTHLSRLFRTEGSTRFWDYVTSVRLDRAKFLLAEYGIPVKIVAARCGFTDTAYFCRVFRRRLKLTPMQYRLKYGRTGGRTAG